MAFGTYSIKTKTGQVEAVAGGYEVVGQMLADSAYPTGGTALTAATLGFPSGVVLSFVSVPCVGGIVYEFDFTNNKLIAYWQTPTSATAALALVEVTNATDLSAGTLRIFAKAAVI